MDRNIAPPRVVGQWGAALFPINGMIGAGIFALPAVLAAAVGSFAPWMMLLGGLLFLPLALTFGWLATRFEHSGGSVLYGEAAFGRFVGFQAGWARYASSIVTVAANTHVMVTYLAALFPVLDGPVARPVSVTTIIAAITIVNLVGMRRAVGTLAALTALKVLPLLGLVVAAFIAGDPAIGLSRPLFSQTESVILLTYYAFIGFENLVETAGEVKDARRNVRRALVGTVAAVSLLYVVVIWAYLAIAPGGPDEGNALAMAAQEVLGPAGALAIVAAAAFSIGANSFAGATTLPRLSYGMAERGMLPRWFLSVSRQFGTPAIAILFYGAGGIIFSLWAGFEVLAVAATLTRLLTYLVSAAALPVLEQREGRLFPLHLLASLFACASTIWVATHADAQSWTVFGGLVLFGTLLYFIAARERLPVSPHPA